MSHPQTPPQLTMMDYFDFNMQLPDEWSDSSSEKTPLTKTPVRVHVLREPNELLTDY